MQPVKNSDQFTQIDGLHTAPTHLTANAPGANNINPSSAKKSISAVQETEEMAPDFVEDLVNGVRENAEVKGNFMSLLTVSKEKAQEINDLLNFLDCAESSLHPDSRALFHSLIPSCLKSVKSCSRDPEMKLLLSTVGNVDSLLTLAIKKYLIDKIEDSTQVFRENVPLYLKQITLSHQNKIKSSEPKQKKKPAIIAPGPSEAESPRSSEIQLPRQKIEKHKVSYLLDPLIHQERLFFDNLLLGIGKETELVGTSLWNLVDSARNNNYMFRNFCLLLADLTAKNQNPQAVYNNLAQAEQRLPLDTRAFLGHLLSCTLVSIKTCPPNPQVEMIISKVKPPVNIDIALNLAIKSFFIETIEASTQVFRENFPSYLKNLTKNHLSSNKDI